MKVLVLFLAMVCAIACTTTETILDFNLVEGSINKLDSAYVIFQEQAYRFPLDAQGKGTLKMNIKEDGFAILVYGKLSTNIYLKQGNTLKVIWDKEDWRGGKMQVVSDDGGINEYIRLNIEKSFKKATECSFTLEEDSFMDKVEQTIRELSAGIDSTNFAPEIKDILKASSKYEVLYWIYKYPRFHNFGKRMSQEEYLAFKRFNEYMFDKFEAHPEYLCLTAYREYAVNWFYELMQLRCFGEPYILKKEKACQYILEHVKNAELREYALAETITPYIKSYGIEGAENIIECFRTNVKNPMYVNLFESYYTIWKQISPGSFACDFRYSDVDGKQVRLSDFKGKYVFIDIWATWCKPCCYEIPFIQEIEHRLAGKDVVFVSISTDKDTDVWRKKVKEENMGGIQLNIGKDRSFTNYFYVTSIPRFIIIDPEQKIVTAHAPKPSSGELEKLLNKLLEKQG